MAESGLVNDREVLKGAFAGGRGEPPVAPAGVSEPAPRREAALKDVSLGKLEGRIWLALVLLSFQQNRRPLSVKQCHGVVKKHSRSDNPAVMLNRLMKKEVLAQGASRKKNKHRIPITEGIRVVVDGEVLWPRKEGASDPVRKPAKPARARAAKAAALSKMQADVVEACESLVEKSGMNRFPAAEAAALVEKRGITSHPYSVFTILEKKGLLARVGGIGRNGPIVYALAKRGKAEADTPAVKPSAQPPASAVAEHGGALRSIEEIRTEIASLRMSKDAVRTREERARSAREAIAKAEQELALRREELERIEREPDEGDLEGRLQTLDLLEKNYDQVVSILHRTP